jgi:sulfoxide reductase heme-binding subunit YedZ
VNEGAVQAAQATGLLACAGLLAALSISPLSALVPAWRGPNARAKALRRKLGIGTAFLGLVHAAVAFVGVLDAEPAALLQTSQLYAGLAALAILLLLLLTSYPRVVQALRLRAWKELHRLSFVAALLVVQHVALSAFAERRLVLALLGVVGVLFVARLARALRTALPASSRTSEGADEP